MSAQVQVTQGNGPHEGDPIEIDLGDSLVIHPTSGWSHADQIINTTIDGIVTVGELAITIAEIGAKIGVGDVVGVVSGAFDVAEAVNSLVIDIMEAVRDANTTTFVVLNLVPNSRLEFADLDLDKGFLVDETINSVTNARVDSDARRGGLLAFGVRGRSEGVLRGRVREQGGKVRDLRISFDNPLGGDTSRSDYKVRYDGLFTWGRENVTDRRRSRGELVFVMLFPNGT